MTTKDFIVFACMALGAIFLFLIMTSITDHYKDFQFLPLSLFCWLVGIIIDRFWKPA